MSHAALGKSQAFLREDVFNWLAVFLPVAPITDAPQRSNSSPWQKCGKKGSKGLPTPPPSSQPAEAGSVGCTASPARFPPTSGPGFPLPAPGPAARTAALRSRPPGPGPQSPPSSRPRSLPLATAAPQRPLRCTHLRRPSKDANSRAPTPLRSHV